MVDNNNCCCFCFDARQGVIIIGILMWIGLCIEALDMCILISASMSTHVYYFWYALPSFFTYLYLGILFCRVRANENTPNDIKTRKHFAKQYLFVGVFVNGALSVVAYIGAYTQLSNFCSSQSESTTPEDCNVLLTAVSFTVSMAFQIYFAHVCKLYANLPNRAANQHQPNPNQHQQIQYVNPTQPSYPPHTQGNQGLYVQPGQQVPIAYQSIPTGVAVYPEQQQYQVTADGTTAAVQPPSILQPVY